MRNNYQYCKLSEENFLRKNFSQMTGKQLAAHMKRSRQSIRARAFLLRLKKNSPNTDKNSYKYWNKEEDNFIFENYNKMTNEELAKILNRSYSSINTRASAMGLKKDKSFFQKHALINKPLNQFAK